MACWNTTIEKINKKIYITPGNREGGYYGKFWVAKILGKDDKFHFKREFVNTPYEAVIDEGIFEIYRNTPYSKYPEHYFLKVCNGVWEKLSRKQIIKLII